MGWALLLLGVREEIPGRGGGGGAGDLFLEGL